MPMTRYLIFMNELKQTLLIRKNLYFNSISI